MKQKTKFEVFNGIEVPVSPLVKRKRKNRYGSIADLDSEDMIEPAEIDRLFLREAFAPILALPVKTKKGWVNASHDSLFFPGFCSYVFRGQFGRPIVRILPQKPQYLYF